MRELMSREMPLEEVQNLGAALRCFQMHPHIQTWFQTFPLPWGIYVSSQSSFRMLRHGFSSLQSAQIIMPIIPLPNDEQEGNKPERSAEGNETRRTLSSE
jgi:hypothetical protein